MYSFASGVRDIEGRQGYIAVGPEMVAIDLINGSILWRRPGIGRPIAATSTRLVTLDQEGKNFVLRLLNTATGTETGRISNFGMPDWAQETGTEADAVQVEATENPAGIEVSWRVRRSYRGGAPPPAHITVQASHEVTGTILIDPDSGQVVRTPTPTAPAEIIPPAPPGLGSYISPTSDVIALDRLGDQLFVLKMPAQAGPVATVTLEARDARDGSTIWETPLAEIERVRPTPQRK